MFPMVASEAHSAREYYCVTCTEVSLDLPNPYWFYMGYRHPDDADVCACLAELGCVRGSPDVPTETRLKPNPKDLDC